MLTRMLHTARILALGLLLPWGLLSSHAAYAQGAIVASSPAAAVNPTATSGIFIVDWLQTTTQSGLTFQSTNAITFDYAWVHVGACSSIAGVVGGIGVYSAFDAAHGWSGSGGSVGVEGTPGSTYCLAADSSSTFILKSWATVTLPALLVAPSTPTGVTATTGTGVGTCTLNLHWNTSTNTTGYYVQYQPVAGGPIEQWGPTTATTVTGFNPTPALVCGTTYNIWVKAYSTSGGGTWSTGSGFATGTAGGVAAGVPTAVTATQGTLTNNVRIAWATATAAVSYNVYRAGTKINAAPVTALTYDDPDTAVTTVAYTVRSVSASGMESVSSAAVNGYPNIVPTSTVAALTATYQTASVGITPTVVDPNTAAGQTEVYTFSVVSQPAAGEGTASVVANKLVWTPPVTPRFGGVTTFTYRVTDKGGATAEGTATVTVTGIDLATFTSFTSPSPLYAGQSTTATAVISNAGSTTWTSGANGIGTDWTGTTSTVGAFRTPLSDASVAPGGSTTVTLPFTAPMVAGNHTISVMMYKAGTVWFNTKSANVTVVVLGPPAVPTGVIATQGTLTNAVAVTWTANTGTTTANYRVYRATQSSYTAGSPVWTLVGSTTFGTNTLTDTFPTTAVVYVYALTSVNAAGESSKSTPGSGYANVAPIATSATLTAVADTTSAGTTPSVTDPNTTAGQAETFVFVVLTQPVAGQGTATVVGNKLVWTPPAAHDFFGATTFTYSVTDKGGSSATGTATVNITGALVGVPTVVTATQGTITNSVQVAWTTVTGAVSYNVYRAGTKINASPVTGLIFDDPNTTVSTVSYTVRSVSASAAESNDSVVAYGYPNKVPTATSATIFATATATGSATPTVTDPNAAAGQTEVYTVTLLSQPAAGQGTASVTLNQLVYTPPAGGTFGGTTTFTYSVADKGGASVTGTATVNVTPVAGAVPTTIAATDGTLTNVVRITWAAPVGAVSFNVSSAPTSAGIKTVIATAVIGTSYDYATTSLTPLFYSVVGVSASGGLSASSATDSGYPNLAPTSTSATLTATATTTSVGVTPTVSDPNAGDAFTFAIVAQPVAGQGIASVVANKLVWTPPGDSSFAGVTTFTYSAIDKAGASVNGTATVTVTAVSGSAPTTVLATDGTLTDVVRVTWTGSAGSAGYNISTAPTSSGIKTLVAPGVTGTSYDYAVTAVTPLFYSVAAVSASGGVSASSGSDSGYPNSAPTATSAALTATATVASAAVTPTVTDANAGDTFTFALLSQPAAGEGSASVVANKLVWTPPGDGSFAGITTFTYSATDAAGASVVGTATLTVVGAVVAVPSAITATQGTVTDSVTVGWSMVPGAASYNVYRDGTKANTNPVTGLTFDHANTAVATVGYTVRSVSPTGLESADSVIAYGYPNKAPTATSASIWTAATTPGTATPSVTDPNTAAGQTESYVFSIVSQPPASEGSASVVSNQLVYTPPVSGAFIGPTAFTYRVTDKAGAAVSGPATVTVSAFVPLSPTAVVATQGTITDAVRVTWIGVVNAAGYNVYSGGVLVGSATGTSTDIAVTNAVSSGYAVRSFSASGSESPDSASAQGWPNLAPTATSATLTALSSTASAETTPSVTDPNVTAGQPETFVFAVVDQPAAGQGVASVVANKLVWTPPGDGSFAGATSFAYSVTDKVGASLQGLATVNVALFIPVAPTGLTATQGTQTDLVHITWSPSVAAVSYNLYKAGVLLTAAVSPFDDATTTVATAAYTVRAVAAAGGESVDSAPVSGWPNAAPTSVTVSGVVATNAVAQPVSITVVDPNTTAGQQEAFTFTPASGVTANGGSFTFANGKLLYTAAPGGLSGSDSVSFTVTDKGGASVAGGGTVSLCTPPALDAGTATITGVTAGVIGDVCNGVIAAAGVVQYRANDQAAWEDVTAFTQPLANSGVNGHYTISRALNAKAGLYQTLVTLMDTAGQTGQGVFPFTVACLPPRSAITHAGGSVDDPSFAAVGSYDSPDVCGAPLTASLQVFAADDSGNTSPLATATLATGVLTAGQSGPLTWLFPPLPAGDYRAIQTVIHRDAANFAASLAFTVGCPAPTIYTVGVSQESGLDAASGLVGMSVCNVPSQTLLTVTRAGVPTMLSLTLYETVAGHDYYRFDYPIAELPNGQYALSITILDGVGRSNTKAFTLIVDRGSALVQLTIGGVPRASGGATSDSLGQFGVKAVGGGLPAAIKQ